jgi:hypothetical protein
VRGLRKRPTALLRRAVTGILRTLYFLTVFYFVWPSLAYAYIDPATTSYLIQIVAGLIITFSVALGMLFGKMQMIVTTLRARMAVWMVKFNSRKTAGPGQKAGGSEDEDMPAYATGSNSALAVREAASTPQLLHVIAPRTEDEAEVARLRREQAQAKEKTALRGARLRSNLLLILGVFAVAAYPLVFLWMENVDSIQETAGIWLTIAELLAGSCVAFALFLLIFRNTTRAILATIVILLIFENGVFLQDILNAVLPSLRYWHVMPILLIVTGVLIYLLSRIKAETLLKVGRVVTLVFVVLIGFNVILEMPKIVAHADDGTTTTASVQEEDDAIGSTGDSATSATGRNMYWLLFDAYSNNYVLEKYLGYDNSEFTDSLESLGFNLSYTSRNEAFNTEIVTRNIANLAYVLPESSISKPEDIKEAQETAVIIPLAESHGYDVVGIGEAYLYGFKGDTVAAASRGGLTMEGEDVTTVFWKQTAAWPFAGINTNLDAEIILSQLGYLQNANNIPDDNTFVLAHFNTPHPPYLFAADGSLLPTSAYSLSRAYYLGQLQFVSTEILRIANTIIENDSDAIIAVVSDHSARALGETPYDKKCIFAALYNGGEITDIEGMTGVNVMITLFNDALGTDIEYVELYPEEVSTQ